MEVRVLEIYGRGPCRDWKGVEDHLERLHAETPGSDESVEWFQIDDRTPLARAFLGCKEEG